MKGTIITIVIVAVFVAAAAAAGGFFYGRSTGEARVKATYEAFFQERGGRPTSGGGVFIMPGAGPQASQAPTTGQGQGSALRGGVTGEVASVEGNIIKLTTNDGEVQVLVNEQTTLRKSTSLTLGELQSGDRVMVIGDRDAQGNLVARSVQVGIELPQRRE
ncbi:MAG: DUF5666 domain-containing protein [Anaerolineae bacterium]